MGEAKRSLDHTLIYAVATIAQHLTSIVMLPIYTRYLTPEDYGLADLLSMGVEIVSLLIAVISAEAIFRFYYEKEDWPYKQKVVFTIFAVNIFVNSLGFLAIYLFKDSASDYIFGGTGIANGPTLIVMYGSTIIFQVMSAIAMGFIRAQQKPILFVFFSILRLALAVAFNLYFVVYRELHITGVVYAVFSFTLCHGVILTIYLLVLSKFSFSLDIAKKSISFSWPLMVSSLALYLTTFADRFFIKHYEGNSELGLYSLAYKFGFIMVAFAWAPFLQYWEARRYQIVSQPDAKPLFQNVFRWTQAFVIFVSLGISVFAQDLLRVMAAPEFHAAYPLIGIIVFSYVFSVWSNYCVFGILYSKRTIYRAYIDWIVFPVTIGLYYLLIPSFGIMGAAWATFFSLGFRFVLIHFCSRKFYDMELEWSKVLSSISLAVAVYLVSIFIELPLLQSLLFNSLLMVSYLWLVCAKVGLSQNDREMVKTSLGRLRERFL